MNNDWVNTCKKWKDQWPSYDESHVDDSLGIDIYSLLHNISENLADNHVIMTDAGSPSYACPTALKAKSSNQFVFNPSQADMGWAIPASVGVALNSLNKIITIIIGDGSFYTNVQELSVIKYHKLPINIIVMNNDGYLSIRNTQSKYHANRVWGVDSSTGLMFPKLEKIANAFEFDYELIDNNDQLKSSIQRILSNNGQKIVEVICKKHQEILPAQSFKTDKDGKKYQAPLHDMYPFLTESEFKNEWKF